MLLLPAEICILSGLAGPLPADDADRRPAMLTPCLLDSHRSDSQMKTNVKSMPLVLF